MTIDILMNVTKELETKLNERFEEYGLTVNQADLLIHFYQYGHNQINATSAIETLQIDKRLMSLALKSLEVKGYIIRHPNLMDKRQKDIEVSQAALEICEDLIAIKEEVNALFEMNLSDEQISCINSIKGE